MSKEQEIYEGSIYLKSNASPVYKNYTAKVGESGIVYAEQDNSTGSKLDFSDLRKLVIKARKI